jgi:hypothetical protein
MELSPTTSVNVATTETKKTETDALQPAPSNQVILATILRVNLSVSLSIVAMVGLRWVNSVMMGTGPIVTVVPRRAKSKRVIDAQFSARLVEQFVVTR